MILRLCAGPVISRSIIRKAAAGFGIYKEELSDEQDADGQ